MKNELTYRKTVKLKKKKKAQSEFSPRDLELSQKVQQHFEVKLLDKMVNDLDNGIRKDGDVIPEAWDSTLNLAKQAIRGKNPLRLTGLSKALAPQSIVASGVHRADVFYSMYQIGALLKKFPFSSSTAEVQALSDFYKQEQSNALFNTDNYKAFLSLSRKHPDWYGCIDELRADIRKLMGEKPNFELVYRLAQHGPGTSIGFEGSEGKSTRFFKWSCLPYTVSPSAAVHARAVIESNPFWIGALYDHYRTVMGIPMHHPVSNVAFWNFVLFKVDYCRYTSVPKTFETERGIAIEPTLNVFLQLGVKSFLYARLKKRWHMDLTNQEWNKLLAERGSKQNDNVTVDLKGASNSVTRMACLLLLPEEWFDFLDDLRSRNILIPILFDQDEKQILKTEMFSAMGNGFTFAIETIIFGAIVRYAMRKTGSTGDHAVYGDDIIVPKAAYQVLKDLLLVLGFTLNEGKSFVDGPFRESCGADRFLGYNVNTLKLDAPVVTVRDVWKVHNSLVNLTKSKHWSLGIEFPLTLAWLKQQVPKNFSEFVGPPSESVDNYLFVDDCVRRKGDHTFEWQGISTRPVSFNRRNSAFLFQKLMVDYHPRPVRKVLDPVKSGGSAYDITIRDIVRQVRTTFTGYY